MVWLVIFIFPGAVNRSMGSKRNSSQSENYLEHYLSLLFYSKIKPL